MSCPLFCTLLILQEGCPYKDPHGDEEAKNLVKDCPAFSDKGCPFKDAKNVDELGELLQTVPDSHKLGGQMYGSVTALKTILESIHDRRY